MSSKSCPFSIVISGSRKKSYFLWSDHKAPPPELSGNLFFGNFYLVVRPLKKLLFLAASLPLVKLTRLVVHTECWMCTAFSQFRFFLAPQWAIYIYIYIYFIVYLCGLAYVYNEQTEEIEMMHQDADIEFQVKKGTKPLKFNIIYTPDVYNYIRL